MHRFAMCTDPKGLRVFRLGDLVCFDVKEIGGKNALLFRVY